MTSVVPCVPGESLALLEQQAFVFAGQSLQELHDDSLEGLPTRGSADVAGRTANGPLYKQILAR